MGFKVTTIDVRCSEFQDSQNYRQRLTNKQTNKHTKGSPGPNSALRMYYVYGSERRQVSTKVWLGRAAEPASV